MGIRNRVPPTAPWFRGGIRVAFDENTAADHTVVAAPGSGYKLRVVGFYLVLAAANALTWKSKVGSESATAISAPTTWAGADTYQPPAGLPWLMFYETAENGALILTLGSAAQVSGEIWYEKVEV